MALSFINECKKFPENEYHVFVGSGLTNLLNTSDFPANFRFYHFDFGVINFRKTFFINKTLQKYERKIKPGCIISTTGPTYFKSKAPQVIGFNLPLYIYHESPYFGIIGIRERIKIKFRKAFHYYFFKRDAAYLIVQNDDVNQRVRKLFSTQKVLTVTNTYNGFYTDWVKYPDRLPVRKPNEIRLLTVTAYYKHKNLEIIPQIIRILRAKGKTNITFVLTLEEKDFHEKIGRNEQIINVGKVLPPETPSLYDECDVMFLPTLAECFSASYPEAMIMKKPIITTDLGFARGICGDAAVYFDPMNAKDAAEKIILLINNSERIRSLQLAGLNQLRKFDTAESRAKKYLNLCYDLSNEIVK